MADHTMVVQFKVEGRVEIRTDHPEAVAVGKAITLKEADRARRDIRDFGANGDYVVEAVRHSEDCSCKPGRERANQILLDAAKVVLQEQSVNGKVPNQLTSLRVAVQRLDPGWKPE